jgi:glutamyl-tRNA synthetase
MSISKADAKARIEAGQPHVIRMKVPNGVTSVNDVLRGRVTFENRTVDDAVLLKSDGFPTYHLASVVDDRLMEITHIIRGEEWLPSVSKHKLLYDAFGWRPPEFVHLPLLLNPDGSKLSKRQGHASVSFYEESGFLPESVLNFVAFLGWNPGSGEEIMSKRELIERFELERLNKAGAIVDMEKLKWVQQQHIRRMCDSEMDRILELARPHFERELPSALQDINYLSQVLRLCSERILFFSDVPRHLYYFFAEPDYTSEDACALRAQLHGYDFCKLTQLCKDALEAIPLEAFIADAMTKVLKEMTKKEKVQYKSAMLHLRYVCTGSSVGANLVDTLQVLGKDRVIARLTAMLGKC